ncbi:hypothetical protein [Streptantibioticus ferralitis]|uniref:Uncharacterized protein n=1 Tax=Streptantibioticus ferralitis TaxID=236510 RepID=A0ABT5Z8D7_9ACTN|nr:hypothetical protein [Streptantibioticus ferralitis]MDF2259816.1 hypothetical protein [Streptantibioticus ferralitis]
MDALLWQLADEYVTFVGDRPQEFQRAGDLVVAGAVVFSEPDPAEWSTCGGVPHGKHPVYIGVARLSEETAAAGAAYVSMAVIPLADPEVIARATFEDAYEDAQPLTHEIGLLWDDAAMDSLRFSGPRPADYPDLDAFLTHAASELAAAQAAGRAPWVDITVNPDTGSNVLAFPVQAENASCYEGRDENGELVCLVLTAE